LGEGAYLNRSELTAKEMFEERKRNFLEEQKKYSWLSWNSADAYVKNYLSQPVITSTLNR
jgi:hypothetical protein